jgi:small subunit ribosomal protein S20
MSPAGEIPSVFDCLTGRWARFTKQGYYTMANTRSAKKSVRKIVRRTEVNKARRTRMRTFVRSVEDAITAGDQKAAQEALVKAQPEIMKAAQQRILPKNTASRRLSRLSTRIKAMGA